MNLSVLIPILAGYILILSGLAYYGYKKTRTEADYLIAGGNVNPIVMALSYGATFISSSSLIGFGGVSAMNGFGLLWLAFLNIALGIFVAFAVFGKRIRKLSVKLNVFTLPSLLGARYESKFITVFSGIMIFVFMPAYTSIVLVGGGRFLQETLGFNYNMSLFILAIFVGFYVISGGLKAVMYSDAFAALVMLSMMILFLVVTYQAVGGITAGHTALSNMKDLVPEDLVEQGHRGWTSMPALGSPMWWTLVSTLIMGVGIGVLAQPQLAMRSMTVKSAKDLNRSVLVGGIFIFFMTGAIYMIGPLSNIIFQDTRGELALTVAGGNVDLVVPILINEMMPDWFVYLFTLTALSAVISTISSLMHVQATSFSEDIFKTLGITSVFGGKISLVRFGVIIGVVAAVILAYILPGGVIAQATSFWFGICAAGFLPVLIGALFWEKGSRAGANASVVTGFAVSIIGFLFFHEKESAAFGISEALFGKGALLGYPVTHIDPIMYALPLSAIVFVVISLWTYKKQGHSVKAANQQEIAK
ncbi:sodium:solute symporter family protein [Virgibacillus alimentarius]|uniref:SSS family solute:Na+ symporter n=1 Tax=Virgibacillus alimentarius TaxID=698769 RepID=A0ABS4S9L5_9BACI|nr:MULTISPECIES: sodium:solute symporter family protein [Virgibacillus]MBP2258206.1 SSS family solute:Na+ symporter [Virgibacillus alimentarius]HLR69613.1 sodium:solute symporter family protein [Virgibacillus sp.]